MALTQHSGQVSETEVLATEIQDILRANIIHPNLVHIEQFGENSATIQLRERGSFTASAGTETSDETSKAYSQTDQGTVTVSEAVVFSEITDKAARFSPLTIEEVAGQAEKAVRDKVEQDFLNLYSGFSDSSGSSGAAFDIAKFRDALLSLKTRNVPEPYVVVGHPKLADDMRAAIDTSNTDAFWGNPSINLSFLNNQQPQPNGMEGTLFGIPIFANTNSESINSATDYSGAMMNPMRALALGDDGRGVTVEFDRRLDGRVSQVLVRIFYGVAEYDDGSGQQLISSQ